MRNPSHLGQLMGKVSGRLILIVGPSGVGKDTLISYCRSQLAGGEVVFPRRAVTRSDGDGFEDHQALSQAEFERCVAAGEFSLSWRAHGHGYGVPASIDADLAAGRTVVVNVSRSILGKARQRYAGVVVVSVTAPRDVVAARLHGRGRESAAGVGQRLARSDGLQVSGPDVVTIDNSGPVETAGAALLAIIAGRPIQN